MKFLKLISGPALIALLLLSAQTQISSCKKEEIIIRDTVLIKGDTVVVKDSSGCYDLKDGLIAHYNFNSGSLADLSGNGNTITFNNATATTDRFGKASNAFLFNGSSSYMRVPNSTSLNPKYISIVAIVKPNGFYTGTCGANNILCKGSVSNSTGVYGLQIYNANGCNSSADTTKEYFGGFIGDTSPGSAASAIADTDFIHSGLWYNVVYTYDGITSKLYINGVLEASQIKTTVTSGNAQDIFIGKYDYPSYPYWFSGVIDEIRLYNRALIKEEVKALNNLKE